MDPYVVGVVALSYVQPVCTLVLTILAIIALIKYIRTK